MNGALLISLVEISEQLNNLTTRFFQTAVKDKIWPVTRRYWANYKKPVRVFQKGEVRTRLAWWDDTSVLWYSEVWVKGQLCTQVVAHVLVIDKKKKYSIPDVQRRMGMKVDSPSLTPEVLEVIQGWSPLQTSK
jgi:acyl-CoA thioesterase FadM